MELGFVRGIPDSLSCILDSKAQDFGFQSIGFRIPKAQDSGFQKPRILDCKAQDFGFQKHRILNSKSTGFRIPKHRIPQAKISQILESEFPYTRRFLDFQYLLNDVKFSTFAPISPDKYLI